MRINLIATVVRFLLVFILGIFSAVFSFGKLGLN